MPFLIDEGTLARWTSVLGLTTDQGRAVLAALEKDLRDGYAQIPDELRQDGFDAQIASFPVDDLAAMYVITAFDITGRSGEDAETLLRTLTSAPDAPPQ